MPIPSVPEVRKVLLEEIKKANNEGIYVAEEIIERLAQRFQATPQEREVRDPSGGRTFDHRIHSAVVQLRRQGFIYPVEQVEKGIWMVKEEIEKVKSAEDATEIALAFLKQHYRFIPQQPIKAVREDNVWLVEIDVGLLRTRIAKIKIDAKTATILEYTIPPEVV